MELTGTRTVSFRDLGHMAYGEAWDLQERVFGDTVQRKISNRTLEPSARQDTVDQLFLVEHPPVITLGKNADSRNLLITAGEKQGVEVFYINRGGDVTFHGPGQLVGYPILDLDHYYTDIGRYLRDLEEVIIRTIGEYGLQGDRLPGATGVWLEPDNPFRARKICAMGIRCSRWVTMHGFALNVNTDLRFFELIVPCGITDKGVTSIEKELRQTIPMEEVKGHFLRHFSDVFQCKISDGRTG